MFNFKLPRLPYRDDAVFSLLILLVLILPLVFFMGTYEKFDTAKLTIWYILVGVAVLFFFFSKGSQAKKTILSHSLLLWILPFLVTLAIVSAFLGHDYINSFFGYYPRLNQSVILFLLWSVTILLLLSRLTRERLEFLLKVLVFGGFLGALAAVAQCLGWGIYLGPMNAIFQRAPGLLGNPNFSGMFLAALAPLALLFLYKAQSLPSKIYYFLTILGLVIAVLMLGSRGAWLGLFAEFVLAVVAAFILGSGRKFALITLAALVISAGLWYVLANPEQTQLAGRSLSLSEANINSRLAVWDIAEQAILERPWFGVGPGNFQVAFEQHRDKSLGSQNGVFDDAHNWFLQLGSTVGLPFLLLNLILIFGALIIGLKKLRTDGDLMVLVLMVSLIGFCIMAAFNPLSVGCYFLLAVLLAGLFYFDAREISIVSFWPLKWVCGLLAVAFIAWGGVFFVSETLFYRAYSLYFAGSYEQSLKLMKIAAKLNPTNRMYFLYWAGDEMRLKYSPSELAVAVKRFVNMHPKDADTYSAASTIYFTRYLDVSNDRADLLQSIEYLKQSLALDSNRASRNIQMAVYLFTNDQPTLALNYDVFGLSLDQSSVPGWLLQARLLQIKGNRDGTLSALDKAVTQASNSDLLKYWDAQIKAAPDISKMLIPVGYQESTLE